MCQNQLNPSSHFDRTPTCDRRTDGHRAMAYAALVQRRAGKILSMDWGSRDQRILSGDRPRFGVNDGPVGERVDLCFFLLLAPSSSIHCTS